MPTKSKNSRSEKPGVDIVPASNTEVKKAGLQAHAQIIIASTHEPLVVLDENLRVQATNRSFYETFNVTPEETENRFIYDVGNGQWNIPELWTLLEDILPAQNQFQDFEIEHEFEGIGHKTLLINASGIYQEANRRRLILLTIKDFTERQRAQEQARISELRYRRLFESARDGILILDNVARKITDANPYMTELLGYTHDELVGKELWEIGLMEDREASLDAFQELQQKGYIRYEDLPLETRNGKHWDVEFVSNVYEEDSHQVIQCNIRDITERKRVAERVAHEALHDSLTGLPNRPLFMEHLHQAIAHAERHEDYLFAVLFLDLDRFKFINDTLGHVVGDRFLAYVARKLEAVVRPEDIVARLSGDEFTILLSDIGSINDATRVAKRINKELSQPFTLAGQDVSNTASIGITLSKHGYISTEDVLRDADTAMYRAKASGGGGYEIFDPSMHASVMLALKLEKDLKLAVEREEFLLHYQPIMSLKDKRITGFEALVRWQHPERGLVLPDEFIPIAEETGLILRIGKWVLHEACRQARKWQDSSRHNLPLSISVNLSGKEFSQLNLIEQISGALEETGLSANSLQLEITESAVMEKSQAASLMLGQLKVLGVKLHIDDFGIGYSSLSALQNLPIDVLKIDRSFVKRMGPGVENSEIVQTIVQLAHNLGMEVTAEGVETAEQLSRLRALGCEYGQGFHFSKPMDGEQARRMIAN